MIATLDRLMLLQQKLHDAEKQTEREPIHIAFDLNELHILQRMLDDSLCELDPYATTSQRSEHY